MVATKDSHSRKAWLIAAWAERRHKLAKFLGRITDLGPLQAMKPAALRKFMKFMEQVGEEQQEETKIISEIDAIEQEHRWRRKSKLLRQAAPKLDPVTQEERYDAEEERPKARWMWILAWYYLLRSKQINQKTHELTGD